MSVKIFLGDLFSSGGAGGVGGRSGGFGTEARGEVGVFTVVSALKRITSWKNRISREFC